MDGYMIFAVAIVNVGSLVLLSLGAWGLVTWYTHYRERKAMNLFPEDSEEMSPIEDIRARETTESYAASSWGEDSSGLEPGPAPRRTQALSVKAIFTTEVRRRPSTC